MKDRIFKHWKTSLLGLCLLIGAGLLVWFGRASFAEVWPALPAFLALIYVKDPQRFKKR